MNRLSFDRPGPPVEPLPVAKTDNERVLEQLKKAGYDHTRAVLMINNWEMVEIARRLLGIK